ncbi:antibiotic biosynthesis monooxygenase [Spiractinospora alimapuensis]|uniref:antibiotic biosynthesis monooxygenase family protein n=1 Tax=Spiractinospora alimapuensis TaxID=2820884 RepID=UPI001F193369|nr:antibiotic biosynthesis monooxygenase [Spiractinospora alimapuensis]QVQ51631.1 antibiotic biosynthesis monooxygenase [Spiractinospora alimapuensis]
MSVVKFNVLSVPEGAGSGLEERFAKRAGLVEQADGFEEFQLLRPVEGTDKYLVYTRWRDEESFQTWLKGQRFAQGHAQASSDASASGPAATSSELWGFEVVQHVRPAHK